MAGWTPLGYNSVNPQGFTAPQQLDASGNLLVASGSASALALSAGVNLVKATPGRVARISVITAGTAGNLAVNDSATTGGVAAGNIIWSLAFGSVTVGQIIELEWPCAKGIVVTVPTGGAVSVSYS